VESERAQRAADIVMEGSTAVLDEVGGPEGKQFVRLAQQQATVKTPTEEEACGTEIPEGVQLEPEQIALLSLLGGLYRRWAFGFLDEHEISCVKSEIMGVQESLLRLGGRVPVAARAAQP